MTYSQAARIIALLEERTARRVEIGAKAANASGVLAVLAVITLISGAILACVAVLSIFSDQGARSGLTFLIVDVLYTALSWGLLTAASVVAGYVANRSD